MLPIRDLNPTTRVAIVTIGLILANLVIFFAWQPEAFIGLGTAERSVEAVQSEFLYEYAMVPCEVTHLAPLSDALVSECAGGTGSGFDDTPYDSDKMVAASVGVSMFLHAGLIHLFGNLWYCWIFGNNVEERFGSVRFLGFYLAGGVVASLAQVATDPDSLVPVVGASGAVAAVMGAYLVQFPSARVVTILPPFFFWPFRLPAWTMLIAWFVLQFYTDPASGVAWVAHVAGFGFGAIVGLANRTGRGRPRVALGR